MTRISRPLQFIEESYDVVVIGSGYGAGIAASRMARAGRRVCVLERGREIRPGEFPDTLAEAVEDMQADVAGTHLGSKTGLFDFRLNHDINVLVGCGLGGTSLINANVSLRAAPAVFDNERWPAEIRQEARDHGLDPYYTLAEEMLEPSTYPESYPPLAKMQAHETSARALGKKFYRTPINVTFEDRVNHAGVPQHKCTNCGDCVTGCNYGAKNTTLMNYLPDAHHHGAEIYTEVEVRHVERQGERWHVHFELVGAGRDLFDKNTMFVSADIVILGAGTLGSTEILLRSRENGLSLSNAVGEHFTGNGDFLAFAYDCDETINGIGAGHHKIEGRQPVGPCITSFIDGRDGVALDQQIIIEEGSIPGALAPILPAAFSLDSAFDGQDTGHGLWHRIKEKARELRSLIFGAYTGALHNTQTYLVMANDDDKGRMSLDHDHLRISWPGVGREKIFAQISDTVEQATKALGGVYLKDPLWNRWLDQQLITVHPLGGCGMGSDAATGVVNHKGQVYAGTTGTDVHPGLYVMDGSVIPVPVGVNPLLTISALAERNCRKLADDHGWTIDYAPPAGPIVDPENTKVGIQFTESMVGYFSAEVKDDYEKGYEQGKAQGSSFEFVLTISTQDVDDMIDNPEHRAQAIGTVTAPMLSPKPLFANQGVFQLFVENPDSVNTRNMIYRLELTAEDGKRYYFEGFKVVRADGLEHIWRDNTTLYITIHDGPDATSPVLGKGILKIPVESFAKQLTTMKVLNAKTPAERLRYLGKFGSFFAGVLFEIYGGVVSEALPFHPGEPRKKRPLDVCAPETHHFQTRDGYTLRLLRYKGGSKGPVIVSPGLGVSTQIFTTDTIAPNLLEYLFAHDYDVWLFDYRTSIALPSVAEPNSGDPVAAIDYPAAVDKVRALTGAESVQMVVHCFGASTFFMSMLSEQGLPGIRSAVVSQIATDVRVPLATEIKAGLHLPGLLDFVGVQSLSADTGQGWADRLFDRFTALQPQSVADHDINPVSRRITFLYGQLYQLAQLDAQTYDYGLAEMFGVANIKAFEHLARMVRAGHIVDAQGKDVYMPRFAERLNLPLTFIHGADNRCYLPESTEITYKRLVEAHGPDQYARHVIPDYGHIDCIFGKNAARDVYPLIVQALDRHAS